MRVHVLDLFSELNFHERVEVCITWRIVFHSTKLWIESTKQLMLELLDGAEGISWRFQGDIREASACVVS